MLGQAGAQDESFPHVPAFCSGAEECWKGQDSALSLRDWALLHGHLQCGHLL